MTYLGLSQCMLQAMAAGSVELTLDSDDIYIVVLLRVDCEQRQ